MKKSLNILSKIENVLDDSIQIHVFDASLEAVLRFGNHFYHGCLLQYFEGCPRVSTFHLNNLDNEVVNEL